MSQPSTAAGDKPGNPSSGEAVRSLVRSRRFLTGDRVLAGLSRLGAVNILAMLFVLLVLLTVSAWPSIRTFGWKFLVSSEWRPNELNVPARDAQGNVVGLF